MDDPARYERAKRRKLIESGKVPGLFADDSKKKLRPEVEAMIRRALVERGPL
jgi:hypothetical protein